MEVHHRLTARIATEQDDLLATLQLVLGDAALEARLWDQLVDLLVEGMFLDLRRQLLAGEVDHGAYTADLIDLATRCRAWGLLPLPTDLR